MSDNQWRRFVYYQLQHHKKRSEHFFSSFFRAVPISLVVGIIACGVTIYFWGFKEWARMTLQLVMGVTIAATIFRSFIRKLDREFGE